MSKVLITTVPFGDKNRLPLELLEEAGIDYVINPFNKKLTEDQLAGLIPEFDAVIAGTEPITEKVMAAAQNLKLISRVGIGLDSVDLIEAERKGIKVSYTPDAPAPAVAELTIGLMLTLLRSVHISNIQMHDGSWHRYFGRRLSEITVGIVGVGRIGHKVLQHLSAFGTSKVLLNDLEAHGHIDSTLNTEWVDKDRIYKEADIITFHLPLTGLTKDMVKENDLNLMKQDAIVINTSRGGIINEKDLYKVLNTGHLGGAAIDVFEQEPYNGNLLEIDRCLLTAHMGSMSVDCRSRMEIEATQEAVRFLTGKPLEGEVPEEEYDVQRQGL